MGDKKLICQQCGAEFVFTATEQERHVKKGFDPPRRCPECRRNRARLSEPEAWEPKRRRQQRTRDQEDL